MGDTVEELKNTKICDFEHYLLNINIINEYVVARGGIEPPTHGFSVRFHSIIVSTIKVILNNNYSNLTLLTSYTKCY